MPLERTEVLDRLRSEYENGNAVLSAGVGNGTIARGAVASGIDLIMCYNTAKYQSAGKSSLAGVMPYNDWYDDTMELVRDVVPLIEEDLEADVPVLAGLCGTDPYRRKPQLIDEFMATGVSGIVAWPSIGYIDGEFRTNLEASGITWEKEVDMIRIASEKDVLTAAFAYGPDTTRDLVEAGCDIIVTMVGMTTGGDIGAEEARTMEGAVKAVQQIADTAHELDEDKLVIAHGGPMKDPESVEYILDNTTDVIGFHGGSAVGRHPVREAVSDVVSEYKQLEV